MARGKLIGHLPNCPTCGLDSMEVRLDKNRNPYAFCEDCNTQILTHGKRKGKLMLQRMTPKVRYQLDDEGKVELLPDEPDPVPEKTQEPAPADKPAPAPEKKPAAKPQSTMMG